MNKQSGHIKLEATLGDITYYKRNGKYLVKRKSCVSSKRLKYSPQYAALRQYQRDFGQASRGGKLIRNAFGSLVSGMTDGNCIGRMTGRVLKVIQSDQANPSGQRSIPNGNLDLLKGFEFNESCSLGQVLKAPFMLAPNAGNDTVSLEIPGFNPATHLRFPQNASHFQVFIGIAAIDFDKASYQSVIAETRPLSVESDADEPISLRCQLSDAGMDPRLLVVGIRFSESISGVYEPIRNAGYQALQIVEVLKPAERPDPVLPAPTIDASLAKTELGTAKAGFRAAGTEAAYSVTPDCRSSKGQKLAKAIACEQEIFRLMRFRTPYYNGT